MEAKDLMVGDWEVFHDSGYASDGTFWKKDRFCQIDSIDTYVRVKWYDEDGCEEEWPNVSVMHLSPIPLTTEILEKNDFKKFPFSHIEGQHQWTWWKNLATSVTLWCCELNDDIKDGMMIKIEAPIFQLCIKVNYVHEFQHALRLCGIKKEIKLYQEQAKKRR